MKQTGRCGCPSIPIPISISISISISESFSICGNLRESADPSGAQKRTRTQRSGTRFRAREAGRASTSRSTRHAETVYPKKHNKVGAEHEPYPPPWPGRKRHCVLCGRHSGSGWERGLLCRTTSGYPLDRRAAHCSLMGLFGNVYLSVLFLLVPLPLFGILRIGLRIGSLGHELLRLN